ncbi:arsenate reductase ArsC [Desulfomonile tiedjei]|uniref:Protein-tyrosine-phosphatase n=1 Tax=Desulfomonile tiedjei (strain ATCC 49306 / DSM 6799 / DCB-1) TaxID=706587 RepID=I4CEI4_DESTA|nr:arsenate reductase ArsC [Desulfomonile tiedjei]AFM27975.1 protein-tyrosine-phosphatase [Desulfomonile tiedjei DSM 6799]
MEKIKVMFLCTHNSARSQIAEAFLRKYAGDRFEVYSAGLEPTGLHPLAKAVMEELGFDMSSHQSKDLNQFLGRSHFGYLITVCARAEATCPIFPGASIRLHWPFEDPSAFEGLNEDKLAKFREIRDKIDLKIRSWLKEVQPRED